MQNENFKKVVIIAAISLAIFWFLRPKKDGKGFLNSINNGNATANKKGFIKKPFLSESDLQHEHLKIAYECLCAYIDAYNDGESQQGLETINNDFRDQIGIEVFSDPSGQLAVRDLQGNDVLVNS